VSATLRRRVESIAMSRIYVACDMETNGIWLGSYINTHWSVNDNDFLKKWNEMITHICIRGDEMRKIGQLTKMIEEI